MTWILIWIAIWLFTMVAVLRLLAVGTQDDDE
jgi:hypothetical protein